MKSPRKILVIQLKRAGDVIVTTPVVAALHHAFPECRLEFLVDRPFAPLLEQNPDIAQIEVYDRKAPWKTWQRLRIASYDCILDFQSSPRSIIAGLLSGAGVRAGYRVSFWGRFFSHSIKRPGAGLSVTKGKMTLVHSLWPHIPVASDRKIYLTTTENAWAQTQIDSKSEPIGLIPTHRRDSRRWPASSFAQLARLLMARGKTVWLFWGPGEKEYVDEIARQAPGSRMIPETSLRQMAALLKQCKTVVTNDNGPMHLAVAVGTPTVTLYGPTSPLAWNPGRPPHRIVQASNLGCLGCNMNECPFGHECMTWITAETVLDTVE